VKAAAALALLLVGAVAAEAQQGAAAEITGRVTASGYPLPGVTVKASSAGLQGQRIAITGENGGFLIPFLPPGDYDLSFESAGFSSIRRRVPVALGTRAQLEVELRMDPVREAAIVEATRRAPADVPIATNFTGVDIERLPVGRDLRSIVLLSPSATTGRSLMISGAPSWDSLFLVDGVVVNEYQTGQPQRVLFEDAIQEVVVMSGGISSEYGRFTGGVVSTITRSGGNDFHGSFRDRITSGRWKAGSPWPGEPAPLSALDHALEATLGGFLHRDRLWFFLAGRDAQSSTRSFTFETNVPYLYQAEDQRAQGKLTATLTPRHSLIASWVESSLAETNVTHARTNGRVLDLDALIPQREEPTRFLALTSTNVLAAQWFVEAHHSTRSSRLQGNGGRSRDRLEGTFISIRSPNAAAHAPFGCGICGDDERDSMTWSAKVSHYRDSAWGSHTLVLGGESFEETRQNRGTRSASEYTIQAGAAHLIGAEAFPVFGSGTQIQWTPYYRGERGSDLGMDSAYVNDRWDLDPRLTLNLGLRYDRTRALDAVGRVISDDDVFSPRLGVAWDVRGDGRSRLIASYGRYAARILEGGGAAQQVGIFNQFVWRYRGPDINPIGTPVDQMVSAREALALLFAWFDSVGGVQNRELLIAITSPESSGDFPRSLRSPAVDEWTIGYALQGSSASVRLDLVSRDWANFYAAHLDTSTGQRIDILGNILDVAQVVNDDEETVRTYRALQLQGSWQRGPLSGGGGYTLSRLRGNDEGEEGVSAGAPRNWPLALWYPEYFGYPQRTPVGYLRQDQRHRARLWANWQSMYRAQIVSFSVLQRFDSGTPYSLVGDIDATGRSTPFNGIPRNPGYSLNWASIVPYYFSDRGAFRTDDVWSTDVAIGYEFGVKLRPSLKFEVLNVFNNAAMIAPQTAVLTRQGGGASSGLLAFNPFTETPVEGVHFVRSPHFGQPTGPESYQPPRTVRASIAVRF
jgi:outer membrane receptor protein involved in Fe transport